MGKHTQTRKTSSLTVERKRKFQFREKSAEITKKEDYTHF